MKTLNVSQIVNSAWQPTEPGRRTDPNRHAYSVTKVTNAMEPRVGDVLSHVELAELCDAADWKVIIV